jgi:predicted CoA-binding protein
MTHVNPDTNSIIQLFRDIHTIAVVGLSPNISRPSFRVAQVLQNAGYRIVPVRPLIDYILGEQAYSDLKSIPFHVDLVDVFRAPEHVPGIVESCIKLGIKNLWLQDGVIQEDAAFRAQQAGITVVMDRCMARDYFQLFNAAKQARIITPKQVNG